MENSSIIQKAASENADQHSNNDPLTVPYILNGELYEILSRNGENVTVKCCSCPSGRYYRGSVRSTGNFHMHIKRRHPYLLSKLHAMKVHSLLERRDRLMKNRKAKLRRILSTNKGARGEHEQHKLKIKRAFQRHQAESKGSDMVPFHELSSKKLSAEPVNLHTMLAESHAQCINSDNLPNQANESLLNSPENSTATCSIVGDSPENGRSDMRILNVTPLNPIINPVPIQQPTPLTTPNPSISERRTLGEFTPPTYSQLKNEAYFIDSPLDLSRGTRSNSSLANNSYESSGIGLEPTWSNATVENTISTGVSMGELGAQNSFQSDCGDTLWWQQRLACLLLDIRNDIRSRNRIEHNRLLLEVAKLKFLYPGFYFDLQE